MTAIPTLAMCLDREGTTDRDRKDLVRGLLHACADCPDDPEARAHLLADLRAALERDDLGEQLTIHVARAFARLNPTNQKD